MGTGVLVASPRSRVSLSDKDVGCFADQADHPTNALDGHPFRFELSRECLAAFASLSQLSSFLA